MNSLINTIKTGDLKQFQCELNKYTGGNMGAIINATMQFNKYDKFKYIIDKHLRAATFTMQDMLSIQFATLNFAYICMRDLRKFGVYIIKTAVCNQNIRDFLISYLYHMCVICNYDYLLELFETTYRKYVDRGILFKNLCLHSDTIACERMIIKYRYTLTYELLAEIIPGASNIICAYLFQKVASSQDIDITGKNANKFVSLFAPHMDEIHKLLKSQDKLY